MIEVELSNIWGSVSLPDLLSGEKDLFDAHMQLRTNVPDGPDFLGWLNAPEGVMARAMLAIGKAAEKIAELGDTLVVVGSGDAPLAAQAAIRATWKRGECPADFCGHKPVRKRLRAAVQPARGAGLLPASDRTERCRYGMRRRLPRCPLAA